MRAKVLEIGVENADQLFTDEPIKNVPKAALPEPDCRRRDEKRPFPLRTKNFSTTQNNRLTGKAPYKSANPQSHSRWKTGVVSAEFHPPPSRADPLAERSRGDAATQWRQIGNEGMTLGELDMIGEELRRAEWVVYSKRPFGGPAAVLAYLSRYTHRVAISNSRLIGTTNTSVTFKWKDYRASGGERAKVMTLAIDEFIRRFLIHVLPDGFHRIRHYGLFANGGRAENIARARQLLNVPAPQNERSNADGTGNSEPQIPSHSCPCCGGRMIILETFERGCTPRYRPAVPSRIDSS